MAELLGIMSSVSSYLGTYMLSQMSERRRPKGFGHPLRDAGYPQNLSAVRTDETLLAGSGGTSSFRYQISQTVTPSMQPCKLSTGEMDRYARRECGWETSRLNTFGYERNRARFSPTAGCQPAPPCVATSLAKVEGVERLFPCKADLISIVIFVLELSYTGCVKRHAWTDRNLSPRSFPRASSVCCWRVSTQ